MTQKFTVGITTSPADPSSVALFQEHATATPGPGRRRSTFSLTPTATPLSAGHVGQARPPIVRPDARDHVQRDGIDWELVARLRQSAADRLSKALSGERDRSREFALGGRIINELLDEEARAATSAGRGAFSRQEQAQLAEAVFDAQFRLGRMQPLVDDPGVENVTIMGFDDVWLEYDDGRLVRGPTVGTSDEDLIDTLVHVAERSEVNARQFSQSEPRLHLRLDGGARLAATAWVTPRPSVVIRRHRMKEADLPDLVGKGSMGPVAASFLAAAVRARRSIVVAGPQGAGKTTLMRALCAEIGSGEAIGTFETEYELHLHEMKDRHPIVHAWEARPGGELLANGRRAGEFTVDDALYDSYRFNLSRQIVGEVRGREVLAMIEAMQSGTGSLSTTHAESAEGAVGKLVTCAMKAGAHVTHDYAVRAIAESLDIVVHVDVRTEKLPNGGFRKRRWTSEIAILSPGEQAKGYAISSVFRCPAGSTTLQAVGGLPEAYRDLARHGFDLNGYLTEAQRFQS